MAITDDEYIEILRYFQEQLQLHTPDIFEHLSEITDLPRSPKRRLINYLDYAIDILKKQSSSSYPRVLNLLNENIQTENGAGINKIQVVFTEEESQLYGIKELDLSELPDKSQLINDLSSILETIRKESDFNERQ